MPRAVDALLVVIQDLCLRQDYLVAAFPATPRPSAHPWHGGAD